MGKTWVRFKTLIGLGFWIFDFVTDIGTLISYWRRQSTTIAALATTSMVLSTLVGLGLLYVMWEFVKKVDEDGGWQILYLKATEAMVESIPQLAINLYVLSICGQSTTAIQNVSTVDPINTGRNVSTTLNASEFESHIPTEGPQHVSAGMSLAGSQDIPTIQYISAAASFIGICVGVVSFDKKSNRFDWLETVLIFTTKAFAILARMFIFVYFSFFLGWLTAIFPVVHTICSVILMIIILPNLEFADLNPCRDRNNIVTLLFVVLYLFVWMGHDDSKWITISFAILYSIENIFLLAISLNVKIYFDEYCLYSDVMWVNVDLNLACLLFAIIFTFKREGENDTINGITEQIGEWSELWSAMIVQVVRKGFSSMRKRFTNLVCTGDGTNGNDVSDSRDALSGDCEGGDSDPLTLVTNILCTGDGGTIPANHEDDESASRDSPVDIVTSQESEPLPTKVTNLS